jgi:hypothetical protein
VGMGGWRKWGGRRGWSGGWGKGGTAALARFVIREVVRRDHIVLNDGGCPDIETGDFPQCREQCR